MIIIYLAFDMIRIRTKSGGPPGDFLSTKKCLAM